MKTGFAFAAAILMAIGVSAPAAAGDDDRRWNDRRWDDRRDDRRWDDRGDRRWNDGRAYRQGYKDGWRAENRRDRFAQRGNGWQNGGWQNGHQGGNWDNRNWNNASARGGSPYWWGQNGRVQCRRQDGTTGLIVGALAGGTLGNVIAREGDKRLGSVIGGTLGAVLGNELARGNVRCR